MSAASLVAAVLLAWRVSDRPLDVAALVPVLESQLSGGDQPFDVRIGGAALEWAGWNRLISVRLEDVRTVDPAGGLVAQVPALSLALHPPSLLRGVVAPVEITLHEPSLVLRRGDDGVALRFETEPLESGVLAPDLLPQALAWVMADPRQAEPARRLERLVVHRARLTVEDARLGVQWIVPSSELVIERATGGLTGELAADLVTARDRADVVAVGSYDRDRRRAEVAIAFGSLRPAAFAHGAGGPAGLDGVDLPLSGTVTLDIAADGTIHAVGADVSASAGRFDPRLLTLAGLKPGMLPARPLDVAAVALSGHFRPAAGTWQVDALRLDLPLNDALAVPGFDAPVPISSVQGRGRLDTAAGELIWQDVLIDLGTAGEVAVSAPVSHRFPVQRVRSTGRWAMAAGRIDVESLDVTLAGTQVAASGTVWIDTETPRIAATARTTAMTTDEVLRYWPDHAASGGRDWVAKRLRGGGVTAAEANLAVTVGSDGLIVDALSGRFRVDGIDVDYLPPMAPLRGVSASAEFDQASLTFAIEPVGSAGVRIDEATVALVGLGGETERAELTVTTSGAVADHLRLIDQPPLGYARAVEIDPADATGQVQVTVAVTVPLRADLSVTDVAVRASARLDDFGVAGLVAGHDVAGGTLDLSVDRTGVAFAGQARVAAVRGRLEGRQWFDRDRDVIRDITVSVPNADLADVQRLVFSTAPVPFHLLNGSMDAKIRIATGASGQDRIDARLDLTDAFVDAPALGWSKGRGEPAWSTITAALDGGRLAAGPRFALSADGLDVTGTVHLDGDGDVVRVEFGRVQVAANEGAGTLTLTRPGVWAVAVRGSSADLEPFLQQLGTGPSDQADQAALRGTPQALTVAVDLDSVRLGEGKALKRVTGVMERRAGRWAAVDLAGVVDGDSGFAIRVAPEPDGRRRLSASADDAGATLRALGLYEDMYGGRLTLTGAYHDDRPGRPLTGRLLITDYHIRNAPALAQVLGMLALTEIDNTLRGEGLSFGILEAPFTLDGRYLSIDDARAAGLSLGVTASGTIDTVGGEVDMRGTVVPIYALNSALGNLPVIGFLFSGGERGGGLFAPTYALSGRLADPQVIVNPMAALTPGVLRGVFDVFDGERSLPDVGVAGDEPD